MDLDTFLRGKKPSRIGRRAWVDEPGFKSLYVRYGDRLIQDKMVRCVTIASLETVKKHKGTFKALIARLHPKYNLWIENVQTSRFCDGLTRMGFSRVDSECNLPSFYLMKGSN